jgi:uncharacterized RDD family membrane protein YckC
VGWMMQGRNSGPSSVPPSGLAAAGMALRIGAWLVDCLVFGAVMALVLLAGVMAGAFGLNPEAVEQLRLDPNAQPSVPLLRENVGAVAILAALGTVAIVGLATVSWARFRGTPGQRFVNLQVADAATGRNLSVGRALLRAVSLYGLWWGALAVMVVMAIDLTATVPADVYASMGYSSVPSDSLLARWEDLASIASGVVLLWPIGLLIWAAIDVDGRSLHDLLAGSLVLGGVKLGLRPDGYRGYGSWGWGPPSGPLPPGSLPPGMPPPTPPGPPPAVEGLPPTGLAPEGRPSGAGAGDSGQPGSGPPSSERPPSEPAPWNPPGLPGEAPTSWGDGVWQTSEDEAAERPTMRRASFGRRAAAYVLDMAALVWLYLTLLSLTGAGQGEVTPEKPAIVAGLLWGAFQIAYFVGGWAMWRGSLGQRILGLEVASEISNRTLGWGDAFVRWAILQGPLVLSTILPFSIRLLGTSCAIAWLVAVAYSTRIAPDGRGPHDRAAHCEVVEA